MSNQRTRRAAGRAQLPHVGQGHIPQIMPSSSPFAGRNGLSMKPMKPVVSGLKKHFGMGNGTAQKEDPYTDKPYKSPAGQKQYEDWASRTAEDAYNHPEHNYETTGMENDYNPGGWNPYGSGGNADPEDVPPF